MGLFDDLALSGIDRVERSLGPRAALRALVALLDTLPAGRARARGVLRGVQYAAELGDEVSLELLAARWLDEPSARASDARRAVARLLGGGLVRGATALAEAEVARTREGYDEGAARYALGRCREAAGEWERALAEHEAALARAAEQPRLRWHVGARTVRALLALGRRDEAAARAGALLDDERGEPLEERLLVAVAALELPGRYRRAAALDALERLAGSAAEGSAAEGSAAGSAAKGSSEVRQAALHAAARHAEQAGLALSALEAERVEAVLQHHPDAAAREAARARLHALTALARGEVGAATQAASVDPDAEALLSRARAVAEGHAAGPRPERPGRAQVGWVALASVAALRAVRRYEARPLLDELEALLRAGARVEAPCWTAAALALRDERLRPHGVALATLLLDRDGEPPPAGYGAMADALDAAGDQGEALGIRAWRRAAARREPGARERLAALLRLRGWRAADAGDAEGARALLTEARRLAQGA